MFFEWFERSPELPGHWTLVTAAEHQVTANLGSQANLNSIFITLKFSFYFPPEHCHLYLLKKAG